MARLANTVVKDEKGKWHTLCGPEVPYPEHVQRFKTLVSNGFKDGGVQFVEGYVMLNKGMSYHTSAEKEAFRAEQRKKFQEAKVKANAEADADEEAGEVSREKLEATATELGIKFNARTKDETLVAKIADAIENG